MFESDFIRPTNIILSRLKNMSSVLQKNFANFYFLIVFAIFFINTAINTL